MKPMDSEQIADDLTVFGDGLRGRIERASAPEAERTDASLDGEILSPELVMVDPKLAEKARSVLPTIPRLARIEERIGEIVAPLRAELNQLLAEIELEQPTPERAPAPPAVGTDTTRAQGENAPALLPTLELEQPTGKTELTTPAVGTDTMRPRRWRFPVGLAAACVVALAVGGSIALRRGRTDHVTRTPAATGAEVSRPGEPRARLSANGARVRLLVDPSAPGKRALPAFVWASVRNATGYEVQFFHGSRRVFRGRTRRPTLTLPARWTSGGKRYRPVPGTYSWYVWPLFGGSPPRRGAAVVQTRVTIQR
jgi:hypothetical protein